MFSESKRELMKLSRSSFSFWYVNGISGRTRFAMSTEYQEVFSILKRVTSGDFVSPNSSVNAAPNTSSRIW